MTRRFWYTGLGWPQILYLEPPDEPVHGDFYWDEERCCIMWFRESWHRLYIGGASSI